MMRPMVIEADRFIPAWWCRGPHAQTIWASLLRSAPPPLPVRRERWETPDGDFLDIDVVTAAAGKPALVILHGLEGSSISARVRGFLSAAHELGWQGLAVNFRSCSGEVNRLRRSYHGGETADLAWVIERVAAERGQDAICCVGLSLGGNMLLKYLGERANDLPSTVRAAVAISAPFDLAASAKAFERGGFNRIYLGRLVRSLKRKALIKLREYPDLVDRAKLATVRTLAEFDNVVTGPVHGFADAEEYWKASSCTSVLASIRIPTLLINALDDPVVPARALPHHIVPQHPFLTAVFTTTGGHVGFLRGPSPLQPVFWAEQKAMAFLKIWVRHSLDERSSAEARRSRRDGLTLPFQ